MGVARVDPVGENIQGHLGPGTTNFVATNMCTSGPSDVMDPCNIDLHVEVCAFHALFHANRVRLTSQVAELHPGEVEVL